MIPKPEDSYLKTQAHPTCKNRLSFLQSLSPIPHAMSSHDPMANTRLQFNSNAFFALLLFYAFGVQTYWRNWWISAANASPEEGQWVEKGWCGTWKLALFFYLRAAICSASPKRVV